MVRRSHGFRVKTRKKLRKKPRDRGMPPISKGFRTFETGSYVAVVIDPSIHKGMPHPRFQGRTGVVKGMQGRVYKVEIKDGKKKKILLCAPAHLKTIKS